MDRNSCGRFRDAARISAQVCSAVGSPMYPVADTTTPARPAAATSMAAFRFPVLTSSFRSGSRSSTSAGNRVRSRIATTASKPCSCFTTSVRGSAKTVMSALSEPQSPKVSATFW